MSVPILAIHGGAGRTAVNVREARMLRRKLRTVLDKAYPVLLEKGALSAAVYAVKLLEDDPRFNAGYGSNLQADGRARLSASVMDGCAERFSAVINVEGVRNPILVSRGLLSERFRVLEGEGAERFARSLGFKHADMRSPRAVRKWKKAACAGGAREKYGTVGACALDRNGHLASATSTGGSGHERPHRVSDSSMPVANYANAFVAVSATGIGEEIIEEGLAIKIAARVEDGCTLREAFTRTLGEARRKKRQMGAIGVDRKGRVEARTTTKLLLFAWKKGRGVNVF